uniref:non-specific serine/threonine protein kinase n=1 Tax=Aegilops tauschii TaxID=37682 RepID=M8BTY4_AEGTA
MSLPLDFLKAITCDFSTESELGRGGYGVVYKGVLKGGKIIAVKKLFEIPLLDDISFQDEVRYLIEIRHPNLVQFIGYCDGSNWELIRQPSGSFIYMEIPKSVLCFEYVCNKSLDKYISDESLDLDWNKRYDIIKGICSGLCFLHEECHILHLDLKPENILMDSMMMPKITDFGLSRLFGEQQTRIFTDNPAGIQEYSTRILTSRCSLKQGRYLQSLACVDPAMEKRPRANGIVQVLSTADQMEAREELPLGMQCKDKSLVLYTTVSKELIPHSISEDIFSNETDGKVGNVKKLQQGLSPTAPLWELSTCSQNQQEAAKESSEPEQAIYRTSEMEAHKELPSDMQYTDKLLVVNTTASKDLTPPSVTEDTFDTEIDGEVVDGTASENFSPKTLLELSTYRPNYQEELKKSSEPQLASDTTAEVTASSSELLDAHPLELSFPVKPYAARESRYMDLEVLEHILDGREKPTNLSFTLLKNITENFSDNREIGNGGFATVYKGKLPNGNVAVKRIRNSHSINEMLFYREVDSLLNVEHKNVVRFLGFCASTDQTAIRIEGSKEHIYAEVRERLLCFEYISNGSLQKYITDELRGLEWNTRYEIIRGICEDFGLSRLDQKSKTMSADRYGSLGYCAPEYLHQGKMSFKSDMYSLGVIIIELVTGEKTIPSNNNNNEIDPSRRPFIWDMIKDIRQMEGVNGKISSAYANTFEEISPYSEDDMLGSEPVELHFHFELNKQMSCSLQLTNETDSSIAFNVENMSPLPYCTQPQKDILPPRSKCKVEITLQPQGKALRDMYRANEFIVWSTKVNDDTAIEDITTDMFIKEADNVVDKVNLDVVFYTCDQQEATEKTSEVWTLDSPKSKYTLSGHKSGTSCLDFFTRDGQQYLISSSYDKTAKIWDMQQQQCLHTLEDVDMSQLTSVVSHPSLPVLIIGTRDGDVHVWSSTNFRSAEGKELPISELEPSPAATMISDRALPGGDRDLTSSPPRQPRFPFDSKRCGFGGLLSRHAVHAASRDEEDRSSSAVFRNRWREEE